MQIDLERAGTTARQRCGIGERALLQHEMLHRLTLTWRQTRYCTGDDARGICVDEPPCWIGALIGMIFERERRVHFAQILATDTAQEIDRAPVCDHAQPHCE